eukprot:TRINITY_DN1647_c0_g1_i4.p1 TRINITY_DN1647_c0_g1~~TRINITY_DN1647_c0_g1_i4.p1  ORF type:complete len:307 (-),score=76.16 TRINITY_DN1647_c0_g1_i4:367-1287(-)
MDQFDNEGGVSDHVWKEYMPPLFDLTLDNLDLGPTPFDSESDSDIENEDDVGEGICVRMKQLILLAQHMPESKPVYMPSMARIYLHGKPNKTGFFAQIGEQLLVLTIDHHCRPNFDYGFSRMGYTINGMHKTPISVNGEGLLRLDPKDSHAIRVLTVERPTAFEVQPFTLKSPKEKRITFLPGFNSKNYAGVVAKLRKDEIPMEEIEDKIKMCSPGKFSVSVGEVKNVPNNYGRYYHTMASLSGKSGSPLIQNERCVGVHASRQRGFNSFIPFTDEFLCKLKNAIPNIAANGLIHNPSEDDDDDEF